MRRLLPLLVVAVIALAPAAMAAPLPEGVARGAVILVTAAPRRAAVDRGTPMAPAAALRPAGKARGTGILQMAALHLVERDPGTPTVPMVAPPQEEVVRGGRPTNMASLHTASGMVRLPITATMALTRRPRTIRQQTITVPITRRIIHLQL